MRIAYFDCFSGISGDMTLGALLDCGADRAELDAAVEALRLSDEVAVDVRREARGHVTGTRVGVTITSRRDRNVPALRATVEDAGLPDAVRRRSVDAIDRIAAAESRIHGTPEAELHLHELSGADTLVDIVGAFSLLRSLAVDAVHCSPLPAPRGRKGEMPLPAPASMRVLEGTGATFEPSAESRELVTPTGAAILAASATFTRPALALERIGYGVGANPDPANLLAVWLGEPAPAGAEVSILETNLDDMAPNLIAAAVEDLMEAGALDVTVVPALMKKGRPAHIVSVIATPELEGRLSELLLSRTTTLGLRVRRVDRVLAGRRIVDVDTPLGKARVKVKELGGKVVDAAPEFEDCRRLAKATGTDLRDVYRIVADAARRQLGLP